MLGSSETENENWYLVSECLLPAESVSATRLSTGVCLALRCRAMSWQAWVGPGQPLSPHLRGGSAWCHVSLESSGSCVAIAKVALLGGNPISGVP